MAKRRRIKTKTTSQIENWNGKRTITFRDKNNKILSWKRWSRKFNLAEANRHYNKHNTLKTGIDRRTYLKNGKVEDLYIAEEGIKIDKDRKFKQEDATVSLSNRKFKAHEGRMYQASIVIGRRRIFANGRSERAAVDYLAEAIGKETIGESDRDEGYLYMIENQSSLRIRKLEYNKRGR